MKILIILCLMVITVLSQAQSIDSEQSKVFFNVMNRGAKVNGTIMNIKGVVNFDELDLTTSSFKATVEASTIKTNNDGRDQHLNKADFFNTENFPEISMESEDIFLDKNGFMANCTLKIKDIAKAISIPFTQKIRDKKQVFESTFTLNRLNFGLGTQINEKSVGFEVEVTIYCEVPMP